MCVCLFFFGCAKLFNINLMYSHEFSLVNSSFHSNWCIFNAEFLHITVSIHDTLRSLCPADHLIAVAWLFLCSYTAREIDVSADKTSKQRALLVEARR